MSIDDSVQSAALALPPEERAELAHALLVSLHEPADADADGEWVAELERRAQGVVDGTAKLMDWEEARQRITARLKARRAARAPR
jgi:putative addiction module component (TIGR02574 family)